MRLSAVITCCVTQKVCVPLCIHMHTAYLRTASVPEDIWCPPATGSGQERCCEVKTPLPTSLPIRGGHGGSSFCPADSPDTRPTSPSLYVLRQRSLSQPRDAPVPRAFCAFLQKKQLLKPMTMKLLSFAAFSSSPLVYMTV